MIFTRFFRPRQEAKALKEQAQEGLEQAKEQGAEVKQVAQTSREFRERNRWAERIEVLIQGGIE